MTRPVLLCSYGLMTPIYTMAGYRQSEMNHSDCLLFFFFRLSPSGVATAKFRFSIVSIFCILLRHFNPSYVLFHHKHKQLFSHTCSLCCGSSESAMVSVPYRHACVTQVLMTLHFSLFEIRRSAITPSTALHAFAPACTLQRTSLSLSLSLSLRLPVSAICPS